MSEQVRRGDEARTAWPARRVEQRITGREHIRISKLLSNAVEGAGPDSPCVQPGNANNAAYPTTVVEVRTLGRGRKVASNGLVGARDGGLRATRGRSGR
jgi:hypothetical protein